MEKKSRFRGPNFSRTDNLLLCDILSKYKHVIENKKTDGATLMQKQKAWSLVTEEFNDSTTGHHRSIESLQQNYKNLKKKAKKRASEAKMDVPDDIEDTSSEGSDTVAECTGASNENDQKLFDPLSMESVIKDKGLKKNIMGTGKRKLDSQTSEKLTLSEKFKLLASEKIEYLEMQKELLKIQVVDEQEKLVHNRLLRSMELEDVKAKYDHNEILRKLELEKILLNKQN